MAYSQNLKGYRPTIQQAFGEEAASHMTTYTWWKWFYDGRESLHDDKWRGRPATTVHDENVAKVRVLLAKWLHLTLRAIAEELNVGKDAVHTTLIEKNEPVKSVLAVHSALSNWREKVGASCIHSELCLNCWQWSQFLKINRNKWWQKYQYQFDSIDTPTTILLILEKRMKKFLKNFLSPFCICIFSNFKKIFLKSTQNFDKLYWNWINFIIVTFFENGFSCRMGS